MLLLLNARGHSVLLMLCAPCNYSQVPLGQIVSFCFMPNASSIFAWFGLLSAPFRSSGSRAMLLCRACLHMFIPDKRITWSILLSAITKNIYSKTCWLFAGIILLWMKLMQQNGCVDPGRSFCIWHFMLFFNSFCRYLCWSSWPVDWTHHFTTAWSKRGWGTVLAIRSYRHEQAERVRHLMGEDKDLMIGARYIPCEHNETYTKSWPRIVALQLTAHFFSFSESLTLEGSNWTELPHRQDPQGPTVAMAAVSKST